MDIPGAGHRAAPQLRTFALNELPVRRATRVFSLQGPRSSIEDLNSPANGTLVNGRALQEPATLREGDEVQIGDVVMKRTADDDGADNASFLEEGLASARPRSARRAPRHAAAPTAPAHAVPGSFEPDLHPASPFVEPRAADADALAELGGEPTARPWTMSRQNPSAHPRRAIFPTPATTLRRPTPSLAELGGSPQPDPAAAAAEWAVAGDSLDLDSLPRRAGRPVGHRRARRTEKNPCTASRPSW